MQRDAPDQRRLPAPKAVVPARRVGAPTSNLAAGMDVEVRTYIGILRRRARLIRLVFFGVLGLALAFSLLQPRVYRAEALLEIRGGEVGVPAIEGLFADTPPSEADLRTHFGRLKSSAMARRVIEDLRLDTLEELSSDGDALMQNMTAAFIERLVVDPVEESRLVSVSFDASSADLSAQVVNAVVDAYAKQETESLEESGRRLADQVDSAEASLEASEEALLEFAVIHGLPYLVEEDVTAHVGARLTDLQGRLTEAQSTRYASESLRDVVTRDGRVDVLEDEVLDALMTQMSDLRTEYARLSATFTDDYPAAAEVRRQIEHVRGLIREEQQRLAQRAESDFQLSLERERAIAEAIEAEEGESNAVGPESGRYYVLRQEILANRTVLMELNGKRREAEVAAALGSTDFAVVDRAEPPTAPYRPVFVMNLALAMMLGLTLGVGAAFLRELLDDTVRSADDLHAPVGVPVLALIPSLAPAAGGDPQSRRLSQGAFHWPPLSASTGGAGIARRTEWPRIDVIDGSDPAANALVDAFGALRTSVLFDESDAMPKSIVVTSCRPGEGKTTVSVNLSMSLAKLGKRVLLVDADLRRPAVHRALRINAGAGLASCLTRDGGWLDSRRHSGVDHVHVLPAGSPSADAADLLSGDRLGTLLREAEELYDFVIVDAPAVFINAPDAKLIARQVDGAIVVLRSRATPRALVDRIPEALPNVIGVVVNDMLTTSMPDYYGDYFTGYGDATEVEVPSKKGEPVEAVEALSRIGHWIQSELQGT